MIINSKQSKNIKMEQSCKQRGNIKHTILPWSISQF